MKHTTEKQAHQKNRLVAVSKVNKYTINVLKPKRDNLVFKMAMEKTQEGATVKVVLQKLSLLPLSFPSPDEALEPHLSRYILMFKITNCAESTVKNKHLDNLSVFRGVL